MVLAGHEQCRSAAGGHRNDAGLVERACKFFEEMYGYTVCITSSAQLTTDVYPYSHEK